MRGRELAWRTEEACFNAWPALRQVLFDGWMMRFADGVSRRANSANPLGARIPDVDAGIAACEKLYRAQGLPPIVRVPSIVDPALERRLERLGYRAEGETVTLYAGLGELSAKPLADVEILSRPSREWLAAMTEIQRRTAADGETYRRIVESIAVPAAFAAVRAEGRIAALAYGTIHDGLLCYESVVTDPRHRGRGFARSVLAALAAWATARGAGGACLQVEAANGPARSLYDRIGLRTELYRYHYRRAPSRNGMP